MSDKTKINQPTEEEMRTHFGDKLKPDAVLMRPDYTTIWALEDGTLLWDWRNGYAVVKGPLESIIYLTGPAASGKTYLISRMRNAVEVMLSGGQHAIGRIGEIAKILRGHEGATTVVFTNQAHHPLALELLRRHAEKIGAEFLNIKL